MLGKEILDSIGGDIDKSYPNDDWNALQLACSLGDNDVTKHILSEGANSDVQFKSSVVPRVTPLHIACRFGHIDIVKQLLPYADTNKQDQWGFTPLHYATVTRNKDLVLLLLSMGAGATIASKTGSTALDIANQLGFEDITDALKSKSNLESDPTVPQFREWLTHLGAGSYVTAFLEAGYDLPFIAKNGLTDADLDCVGVPSAKRGLRRKIAGLHELGQFYDVDADDEEEEDEEEDDDEEEDEEGSEEEDEDSD